MALPSELPSDWFSYTPEAKSQWLTTEGVTPQDLLQVGVSQSDIDYMAQNYGYDPAAAARVEQERIEQELTDVRTELAETRGAYRLGRFILGFLSVGGVGALLMWMTGQSGK